MLADIQNGITCQYSRGGDGTKGVIMVNGERQVDVVVAGHLCLDIIVTVTSPAESATELLAPGRLLLVEPAALSAGGAVGNTGAALRRLGLAVRLVGIVGDDAWGEATASCLHAIGPELTAGLRVARGQGSAYTVVINPPGIDRIFLHYSGPNDAFTTDEISLALLPTCRALHIGYPTLLKPLRADGGTSLATLLAEAQRQNVVTSLDMALFDAQSEASRTDWNVWLARVLPTVDLFVPSLEEAVLMLDPSLHADVKRRVAHDNFSCGVDGAFLSRVADQLLRYGARIVALKLGDQGIYVRTGSSLPASLLTATRDEGGMDGDRWCHREILAPCYVVHVVGTTGSGDCTAAGLLAALLNGLDPIAAVQCATAVGACSVEAADSTSGVRPWGDVRRRLAAGWAQSGVRIPLVGWQHDAATGVWCSPRDGQPNR